MIPDDLDVRLKTVLFIKQNVLLQRFTHLNSDILVICSRLAHRIPSLNLWLGSLEFLNQFHEVRFISSWRGLRFFVFQTQDFTFIFSSFRCLAKSCWFLLSLGRTFSSFRPGCRWLIVTRRRDLQSGRGRLTRRFIRSWKGRFIWVKMKITWCPWWEFCRVQTFILCR